MSDSMGYTVSYTVLITFIQHVTLDHKTDEYDDALPSSFSNTLELYKFLSVIIIGLLNLSNVRV